GLVEGAVAAVLSVLFLVLHRGAVLRGARTVGLRGRPGRCGTAVGARAGAPVGGAVSGGGCGTVLLPLHRTGLLVLRRLHLVPLPAPEHRHSPRSVDSPAASSPRAVRPPPSAECPPLDP